MKRHEEVRCQGQRNWLKFGAADEKGEVLEESWRKKATKGRCLAVEFGSFLGYSAVKIWRSLGKGSKARGLCWKSL